MNTPELKRLTLAAELKAVNEGNGYIEGYANVFNVVDSWGDKTLPGAFSQDLQDFTQKGYLAVDHEWEIADGAIGDILEAREDANGLWFRAEFYSDDCSQKVRKKVTERLARGKEIGLSIGYYAIDTETVTENGETVRLLKRIQVKEVSVVFQQANEPSLVTSAKSREDEYKTLTDATTSYCERLKSIQAKGRSDEWTAKAINELKALAAFLEGEAETLTPQASDDPPTDAPGAEEQAIDLDTLRLEALSATRTQ